MRLVGHRIDRHADIAQGRADALAQHRVVLTDARRKDEEIETAERRADRSDLADDAAHIEC